MDIDNFKLPLALAILGFVLTTRKWIMFMHTLNPFAGLVVYYTILTLIVIMLEYLGLVIAGIKLDSIQHTMGTILIIFAFFITVKLESCYINTIAKGSCVDISNVYLQSEDGAVYWLWTHLFNNPKTLRLMTYVFTPVLLSFIGTFLITDKIVISPLW